MIYLWAIVNGIAVSLIYIPGLTTSQKWFPAKRGLVSGIVNLSFGISAAIMAPLFASMLKSMGYRSMNLTIALAAAVICLIGSHYTEVPERVSLTEPTLQAKSAPVAPAAMAPSLTVREALHTSMFWCLWGTWALEGAACISMVTLSVAFGLAKGFTFQQGIMILMSFNLTSGLIRILAGYFSDVIGRRPMMSIAFVAAGLAYLLLAHANTLPMICALAMIIGLGFGILFAVSAPLATDCFGLKHFGAIFGLVFTAYGFVASILGPALSGFLLDTRSGFGVVFAFLGVLSLLAGGLILFVRRPATAKAPILVNPGLDPTRGA